MSKNIGMTKKALQTAKARIIAYGLAASMGLTACTSDVHASESVKENNENVTTTVTPTPTDIPDSAEVVLDTENTKVTYSESAFGCRKKIRNATLNLVSHAKIVLQDVSNSISFSILFNKPIGLIVTNEFMSHNHENRYMKALSALTSIPIFYIGFDDYDNFKPMNLKSQIREKYIYKYLTSNKTENLLTSDIVIKYFNEKRKNNA